MLNKSSKISIAVALIVRAKIMALLSTFDLRGRAFNHEQISPHHALGTLATGQNN